MGSFNARMSCYRTKINVIQKVKNSSIKMSNDDVTENADVQLVNMFKTHDGPLSKSNNECKGRNRIKSKRQKNAKILLQYQSAGCKNNLLVPGNSEESKFAPCHSLKIEGINAVALDPSRFRVEQKASIWSRYQLLEKIGKGSFGEVYVIEHKETLCRRALKSINKKCCQTLENYIEEIENLKNLVYMLLTIGSS